MRRHAQPHVTITAFLFFAALLAPPHSRAQFGVTFHYEDYRKVLSTCVDDQGRVDYTGLQANRAELDNFVRDISGLYIELYDQWEEPERIAFWCNAYNALTLRSVVDHYPIKSDWKKRLLYPVGIRHIPGVWTEKEHSVKASKMSLDQMEHEVLRTEYREPRIHFALVCAAKGCPPLRREPYITEQLEEQLDDQARRFLARAGNFRIDREAGVVRLSPLFEWFEEDFAKVYADKPSVRWGTPGQRAVLAYLLTVLGNEDRKTLQEGDYTVKYLDYDWSLNDQAGAR